MKLLGKEARETLVAANGLASSLIHLERFEESKSVLRKTMPVARRVFGESHEDMLRLRWTYGQTLYRDTGSSLEELREAVTTLEEIERIARRVFGGAHPLTEYIVCDLRNARAELRAYEETQP